MVNGNAYAHEDVKILFDGSVIPLVGYTNIEYTTEKNHYNIHGAGDSPVEMGRGLKNFSGSITLLQSALHALQSAITTPGKDITNVVYNLTVAYAPEGGTPSIDRLVAVRFTSVPKGIGTQNPHMEITLPMVIGEIKYNV